MTLSLFYSKGIIVHPDELTPGLPEQLAEAGINSLGIHPVGGKQAHESLEAAIALNTSPQFRNTLLKASSLGIATAYQAHTMSWLLPRSLFITEPSWFRMDASGTRKADFNLCASNTDALDYVATRSALLADLLHTKDDKYYFWLDDVTGYTCHCPACQKLTASDQALRILNAMLSGIRTKHPQAKLCFLAYCDTLDVPKCTGPLDGIFLEFAPIHRNHHRPLADRNCEENILETRSIHALLSFFGVRNSTALDYWMDNSLFSNWQKPPQRFVLDETVLNADLHFYEDLGFENVTSFGCYLGPDYQALYGIPPIKKYGELLNQSPAQHT